MLNIKIEYIWCIIKIFIDMKETAQKLKDAGFSIKHLNLGGGFSIKYNPEDPSLNLENLKKIISFNF